MSKSKKKTTTAAATPSAPEQKDPEVIDTSTMVFEEITPGREGAYSAVIAGEVGSTTPSTPEVTETEDTIEPIISPSEDEVLDATDMMGAAEAPTEENSETGADAATRTAQNEAEPELINYPGMYLSLLNSNEYMPCLVALLYSYRKVQRGMPFGVMVTDNITQENRHIIEAFGAQIIDVPRIKLPYTEEEIRTRTFPCWEKLNMFRLQGVDKIVYVDSDMVFLRNTDELFSASNFSSVFDAWGDGVRFPKGFNFGLFVFEPNSDFFDTLMKIIEDKYAEQHQIFYDDQNVIQEAIGAEEWNNNESLHLDKRYNYQIRHMLDFKTPSEFGFIFKEAKILHMSGNLPKPWSPGVVNSLTYYIANGGCTYAAIMEQYCEYINGVIGDLYHNGLTSANLNPINLTMNFPAFGTMYPRYYKFADEATEATETAEATGTAKTAEA